jgi:hypothetical protein
MRVRINEAGGDHQTMSVHNLRRAVAYPADFRDFAITNGDIDLPTRRAGAVDHGAILDQQIVGHVSLSPYATPSRTILSSAGVQVDC